VYTTTRGAFLASSAKSSKRLARSSAPNRVTSIDGVDQPFALQPLDDAALLSRIRQLQQFEEGLRIEQLNQIRRRKARPRVFLQPVRFTLGKDAAQLILAHRN
jgi:hypothetical protein